MPPAYPYLLDKLQELVHGLVGPELGVLVDLLLAPGDDVLRHLAALAIAASELLDLFG